MKAHVFGLLILLSASAVLFGQDTPAKDNSQELDKKLKELQAQIDELKKKQDALVKEKADLIAKKAAAARQEAERKRKELETRRAKEEAAKKNHFVKMEIRGTLTKGQMLGQTGQWHVVINELVWALDFGDKKDLVAQADKLVGEGVVITGKVVTKRSPLNPYVWPGTGWPVQPDINPGWPNPNPNRWPADRWNPGYVPFTIERVIVQVESIAMAKE